MQAQPDWAQQVPLPSCLATPQAVCPLPLTPFPSPAVSATPGTCADWDGACGPAEAIKMNQCQGVYLEEVDVRDAKENVVDCVAVQYGHILNSRFDNSDWGIYLKGGCGEWAVLLQSDAEHAGWPPARITTALLKSFPSPLLAVQPTG